MLKLIKWVAAPVLAVALIVAMDAPNVEAGNGFALRIGGFGISTGGHHGHHGYRSTYRGGYFPQRSHFGGHYGGHGGSFHNTSHLDYHAPSLQRHGNHYDYVPGHYDVHQTGHWHH